MLSPYEREITIRAKGISKIQTQVEDMFQGTGYTPVLQDEPRMTQTFMNGSTSQTHDGFTVCAHRKGHDVSHGVCEFFVTGYPQRQGSFPVRSKYAGFPLHVLMTDEEKQLTHGNKKDVLERVDQEMRNGILDVRLLHASLPKDESVLLMRDSMLGAYSNLTTNHEYDCDIVLMLINDSELKEAREKCKLPHNPWRDLQMKTVCEFDAGFPLENCRVKGMIDISTKKDLALLAIKRIKVFLRRTFGFFTIKMSPNQRTGGKPYAQLSATVRET